MPVFLTAEAYASAFASGKGTAVSHALAQAGAFNAQQVGFLMANLGPSDGRVCNYSTACALVSELCKPYCHSLKLGWYATKQARCLCTEIAVLPFVSCLQCLKPGAPASSALPACITAFVGDCCTDASLAAGSTCGFGGIRRVVSTSPRVIETAGMVSTRCTC
jgi:hypothetical protein